MTSRPSPSFQPSLAFPRASRVEEQPSLLEARREPVEEPPEQERQRGPVGSEGAPGRFVSRLLAERQPSGAAVPRHGNGLPAPSHAARLAPSVPPLQTSLFSSPVSADSGEGASGARAVKAPPAPETVLGLDRARYATGLERLRPAGHRAMETQETTMEASPLASGQKGKARDILAAIHTLKQIEQEHRPASCGRTPDARPFRGLRRRGPASLSRSAHRTVQGCRLAGARGGIA